MITEYPYMVTYRLKATGRKYHYKKVDATHQAEAMRIFEASMPSATVVSAHALPQNYKQVNYGKSKEVTVGYSIH